MPFDLIILETKEFAAKVSLHVIVRFYFQGILPSTYATVDIDVHHRDKAVSLSGQGNLNSGRIVFMVQKRYLFADKRHRGFIEPSIEDMSCLWLLSVWRRS